MKKELKTLFVVILTALIFVGGGILIFNTSTPQSTKVDPKYLVHTDSHSTATGIYNYQLTIVEFGDFQCPGCAATHFFLKQLMTDYPGKFKLVFRHFPLQIHKNSIISAEASEAAAEQGKFWEMHDQLYEHQDEWSESEKPVDIFVKYAQTIGIDVEKFKKDLGNEAALVQKIQNDRNDGLALEINSTPTLYFNGEKYEGALGYLNLKQKVEQVLAAADKTPQTTTSSS